MVFNASHPFQLGTLVEFEGKRDIVFIGVNTSETQEQPIFMGS